MSASYFNYPFSCYKCTCSRQGCKLELHVLCAFLSTSLYVKGTVPQDGGGLVYQENSLNVSANFTAVRKENNLEMLIGSLAR
jgi:hypothetical protein